MASASLSVDSRYVFEVEIEEPESRSSVDHKNCSFESLDAIPDHWIVSSGMLKKKKEELKKCKPVLVEPEKFKDPWVGITHDKSFSDFATMMKDFALKKPSLPSDEELPQLKPHWDVLMKPSTSPTEYQVTWIGHSTFLIQYRGVNILTDPVFSERCSPSQFVGPTRIKPIPFPDISKLPRIHMVVISHNHYDHLDEFAFKELQKHHNPIFLLPFKMKYKWMTKYYNNVNEKENLKLFELDWWKGVTFKTTVKSSAETAHIVSNVTFTFLPAQHWGSRTGFFDRNEALWGSWGITFEFLESNQTITRKFWHAGDTGYNNQAFNQIGERFGPIDFAMIPIGAYEPRWFMNDQHIDPEQAIRIAKEVKAKKSVGMHWGTFVLTLEPVMEPKHLLETGLKHEGLKESFFVTMKHGETVLYTVEEENITNGLVLAQQR